jgi:hypothetical protein
VKGERCFEPLRCVDPLCAEVVLAHHSLPTSYALSPSLGIVALTNKHENSKHRALPISLLYIFPFTYRTRLERQSLPNPRQSERFLS